MRSGRFNESLSIRRVARLIENACRFRAIASWPSRKSAKLKPHTRVLLCGSDASNACLAQLPFRETHLQWRNVPSSQARLGDFQKPLLEGEKSFGRLEALPRHERAMKRGVHVTVGFPTCFVELRAEPVTCAFSRLQPEAPFAGHLDALRHRSLKVDVILVRVQSGTNRY